MSRRLIILTGQDEIRMLMPCLGDTRAEIVHVQALDTLQAALAVGTNGARLLSFCTAVIVPLPMLAALHEGAYNIHPGPPYYPGRHPECWGAYDGHRRFGATIHEMAPRVDEGPIIDVEWIDMPAGAGNMGYGLRAYRAALTLFQRWAPRLAAEETPPPISVHRWSGRKTTHAQYREMLRVTPELDEPELARRQRSFAEMPGSRMTLVLHGREFVYTVPTPGSGEPA